jgi:gluconolactonase
MWPKPESADYRHQPRRRVMTALYEQRDERFRACSGGDQQLERLSGGCRWAEGPLYVPAGRYAIWSDIPNEG